MRGKSASYVQKIDGLIEENAKLKNENLDLMKRVVICQKRAEFDDSPVQKTAISTVGS